LVTFKLRKELAELGLESTGVRVVAVDEAAAALAVSMVTVAVIEAADSVTMIADWGRPVSWLNREMRLRLSALVSTESMAPANVNWTTTSKTLIIKAVSGGGDGEAGDSEGGGGEGEGEGGGGGGEGEGGGGEGEGGGGGGEGEGGGGEGAAVGGSGGGGGEGEAVSAQR
jgi:hypothetical protein